MTQDEQQSAVVAICESRASGEAAIAELHREGLDLERLSIAGHQPQTEQLAIDAQSAGQFIVLVQGTPAMIVHARAILGTTDSSHDATFATIYSSSIARISGFG